MMNTSINMAQSARLPTTWESLCDRYNVGEVFDYLYFWSHRGSGLGPHCLSQWYPAPMRVDGQLYPTAEHFMMAEKARLFGDRAAQAQILAAPNPGAAKELGRKVAGFDEAVWNAERFAIVVRASREKLAQHPDLLAWLRGTQSQVLVESSPYDRIWGIGLTAHEDAARNPNLWRGLNLLGFALMVARDELS